MNFVSSKVPLYLYDLTEKRTAKLSNIRPQYQLWMRTAGITVQNIIFKYFLLNIYYAILSFLFPDIQLFRLASALTQSIHAFVVESDLFGCTWTSISNLKFKINSESRGIHKGAAFFFLVKRWHGSLASLGCVTTSGSCNLEGPVDWITAVGRFRSSFENWIAVSAPCRPSHGIRRPRFFDTVILFPQLLPITRHHIIKKKGKQSPRWTDPDDRR